MILMKKQGDEYTHFISLLNKTFGKHFIVFHKSADDANEFMRFSSFSFIYILYLHVCFYMYIKLYNVFFYILYVM